MYHVGVAGQYFEALASGCVPQADRPVITTAGQDLIIGTVRISGRWRPGHRPEPIYITHPWF